MYDIERCKFSVKMETLVKDKPYDHYHDELGRPIIWHEAMITCLYAPIF